MTIRLEGNTSLYLGMEGDVGESFDKGIERRLWWRRVSYLYQDSTPACICTRHLPWRQSAMARHLFDGPVLGYC